MSELKVSLDSQELAERIEKECYLYLEGVCSSFRTSKCAELIDAYVDVRVAEARQNQLDGR